MRRMDDGDADSSAVHIDLVRRRVMLIGDLTDIAAAQVIQAMIEMNDAKKRRTVQIELWIHSGGGSPGAALAICDVMRYVVDAEVVTVGMGLVCSAATLPLLLGDERLVFPSTEIMIHGATRYMDPEKTRHDLRYYDQLVRTIQQTQQTIRASNSQYASALVERAGWTSEQATAVLEDGLEHWFMGGEEIIQHGLADAVLGPTD